MKFGLPSGMLQPTTICVAAILISQLMYETPKRPDPAYHPENWHPENWALSYTGLTITYGASKRLAENQL